MRRLSFAIPLAVIATALPIAAPVVKPHVRTWSIDALVGKTMTAPGEFGLVGVSWPSRSHAPKRVEVRTSRDGNRWSGWTSVDYEADVGPDRGTEEWGRHSTEPVWTGRNRKVQVRFTGGRPAGAQVDLVDPGRDPTRPPLAAAEASPSQPTIITRAQWGADESIRKKAPEYAEPLTVAIVHHTATTDSYSKADSARIVRSIYAYHVKTNGWNDIGYNFLVDKYGQIFEGRYGGITRTVIGAHALGFNKFSTGISVIGTFAKSRPPAVALNALKRILAWRLDLGFVDPTGSLTYISNGSNKWKKGAKVSLKTISAHRDVGQTTCPGDAIYGALGFLRTEAAKDGAPKLYDAKVSRPIITPNGDGVADGLKVTGRFSAAMTWTVDVLDSASTVLHTTSGSGTTLSVNWYGKTDAGALVPQDTYRFRITTKGSAGTIRTGYVPFTVFRYPDGTFFQALPSKKTYILENNVLRHPSAWQARGTRYGGNEFVSTTDDIAAAYKVGPDIGFREGSVVRADDKLYVISAGARRPVSEATLTALHYDLDSIVDTTAASLAPHPVGESMKASQGYPMGATTKSSSGAESWILPGGTRSFFSRNTRLSWQVADDDLAGPVQAGPLDSMMTAQPIGFRDGTLVRLDGGDTIYIISDGLKRPFTSAKVFDRMGFKRSNVRTATETELALHPDGKPI